MIENPVKKVIPLSTPWPGLDPYLFCMYHLDNYPNGNGAMAPDAKLHGRDLGQDFANVDGWNMYHGETIPGFPQHPHRGFETVTIVRKGLVDHADSLGAAARFGNGDTQWITAGRGISHSEMFPLINDHEKNPLDLFQIWLNLPKKNKMVEPHFSILWEETTPKVKIKDGAGKFTEVTLVAGQLGDAKAPSPPPNSWAADPQSDLAIWTIQLEAGAQFTLPKAQATSNRMIYFFQGESLTVAGTKVKVRHAVELSAGLEAHLQNGSEPGQILMLQGKPLNEPVAQHGPFVMNTREEIQIAFQEYQQTQFGGWPWPDDAPVHAKHESRFAKYPDGRIEKKSSR